MKVSVAQVDCHPGDVERNMETVYRLSKQARLGGAEVVVFPEMMDTGYEFSRIGDSASSWAGAPFKRLQEIASEFSLYIISGLSQREGGELYNAVAVVGPDGNLLANYRKVHLFSTEPIYEGKLFTPGDSLVVLEVARMKWGFMVCYDLRFPELARSLALQGVEVLVVPSAWPFPRQNVFRVLSCARAIENQVYLLSANRVGRDGEVEFCGGSQIIHPGGGVLAVADEKAETLLYAEVNAEEIRDVREHVAVYEHRRPEVYQID